MPVSSHSTFISLPDEQELSAVSRNTEVDLFTHTEIKPAISTGTASALAMPDVPVVIFEPTITTGTVVLTVIVTFLFFGLTGTVVLTGLPVLTVFSVLAGTVVLVAVVGNADTANTAALNESGATLPAAFATDTLDETHDAINKTKTKNRLTTTPPAD